MHTEARLGCSDAIAPRPLAELLECPAPVVALLNTAAQCLSYEVGDSVFRQSGECQGLYLIVSGQFQRRTERVETRLTLGPARAGDLVELAAALGDLRHTYSLIAVTSGSVLMLPIDALQRAFMAHPPLRMQLLAELAREVSRAYAACCVARMAGTRRRSPAIAE